MTIEKLVNLIEQIDADAWEITDVNEEGWEFYFIRHRLDQNRVKLVRHTNVKLYKRSDDGQYLGSASGEIAPTATPQEAQKALNAMLYSAGFVKNPYYTLNEPTDVPANASDAPDVSAISQAFMRAMQAVPEDEWEDVNSYELFVSDISRHYMNSRGVDVTARSPRCMLEAVVNARRDGHEIELYRMYTMGGCDEKTLTEDIARAMRYGRDKLIAQNTPALGKIDLVLSTDAAREVYDFFLWRMNAVAKARGMSPWDIGQNVVEGAQGDVVTLRAVRTLPNSSRNAAFDSEGAPIRDVTIIDNGVAQCFLGERQFSQYLGLSDSFIPGNVVVSGGSRTEDELRQGDYLEAVEFSDFQVDSLSGDVAGEIRLGYWHHDGVVTPVSGGSVSGSMQEFAKNMLMSASTRQYDRWLIPAATRLKGVTVTGAE